MAEEFSGYTEAHAKGIEEDADPIAPGAFGTHDNPYLVAPADMDTNGLPYGAWCVCVDCNLLGRSTIAFDYYGENGAPLRCERCAIKKAIAESKPSAPPE